MRREGVSRRPRKGRKGDGTFFIASFKVGRHLNILYGLLLLAYLLLDGVTIGRIPAVVAGWEIFITGLVAR